MQTELFWLQKWIVYRGAWEWICLQILYFSVQCGPKLAACQYSHWYDSFFSVIESCLKWHNAAQYPGGVTCMNMFLMHIHKIRSLFIPNGWKSFLCSSMIRSSFLKFEFNYCRLNFPIFQIQRTNFQISWDKLMVRRRFLVLPVMCVVPYFARGLTSLFFAFFVRYMSFFFTETK